ncbi:hypothetical protein ABT168_02260 [Streptomyces sp. NPDC001793]|uniref:hypothetical protein n=1 Tax=Streptomyces sp. NPDC001793 TaxID=3154657 RepID=UPI00332A930B
MGTATGFNAALLYALLGDHPPRRQHDVGLTTAYDRRQTLGRPSVDQHSMTVDAPGTHTPWVAAAGRRHPVRLHPGAGTASPP